MAGFRRVRADMELYHFIRKKQRCFPFREGVMKTPEITEETSPFAGGPPRGSLVTSGWLSISKKAR